MLGYHVRPRRAAAAAATAKKVAATTAKTTAKKAAATTAKTAAKATVPATSKPVVVTHGPATAKTGLAASLPVTSPSLPATLPSTTSSPSSSSHSTTARAAQTLKTSPSPSVTPSSTTSVTTIAVAIVASLVGLTLSALLVAFVLRRWNRKDRASNRESLVNFDAKAFRRSAVMLDDDNSHLRSGSPLPPPNPHFAGPRASASLSVRSGYSAQTTVAAYNPYPYGAGLTATPYTPNTHSPVVAFVPTPTSSAPVGEYYDYSPGYGPAPSPVPVYGHPQMQMYPGYAPAVHSVHSVQMAGAGYPPEMHRRYSPPTQQQQPYPAQQRQQHYAEPHSHLDDAYGGI